jgi:cytochrome b pre-mRNA-processing protein 3
MIRFLFPRLTRGPARAATLFAALVGEARKPHWYLIGKVPDTIDGRFGLLVTITALAAVRLEHGGEAAREAAVGLAERFVEAMDSEHREMGIGDPALGKTVRKLVGSLGRRIDLWRDALGDSGDWEQATVDSLFFKRAPSPEAAEHCGQHLRLLWTKLVGLSDEALAEGRLT